MASGIKVFNAAGAVRLDTTERITRLIYTRELPKDESSSVAVPGFDPTKGVAFAIAKPPSGTLMYAGHTISVSGNVVYWSPVTPTAVRVASTLMVVMYG